MRSRGGELGPPEPLGISGDTDGPHPHLSSSLRDTGGFSLVFSSMSRRTKRKNPGRQKFGTRRYTPQTGGVSVVPPLSDVSPCLPPGSRFFGVDEVEGPLKLGGVDYDVPCLYSRVTRRVHSLSTRFIY